MASPQGKAVYKKKDGVIAVSDDHTRVTWTPVAGGSALTLATANITSGFHAVQLCVLCVCVCVYFGD